MKLDRKAGTVAGEKGTLRENDWKVLLLVVRVHGGHTASPAAKRKPCCPPLQVLPTAATASYTAGSPLDQDASISQLTEVGALL